MTKKSQKFRTRKKKQPKVGDTFELLNDDFGLPAGFYSVRDILDTLLLLKVGKIDCGCSLETLGAYRLIDPNFKIIDWKFEEEKFEAFANDLFDPKNWNEIDIPDVTDPEFTVRELKVH